MFKKICIFTLLALISTLQSHPFPWQGQPTLETERFILRPLILHDVEHIYAICSNTEVTRYYADPRMPIITLEDAKRYIEKALERYEKGTWMEWVIIEKEKNVVIGIAMFWVHRERNLLYTGTIIRQQEWGKGCATEVKRAQIAFGFDVLQCSRIEATADPRNIGSNKSIIKSGMKFEAYVPNKFFMNGEWCDRNLYAITCDDYQKSKPVDVA
jgi:ribosomal-protein-alanine N-acetyltransferase